MSNSKRLVAYISKDVAQWISREAKKLGMNESTFVRFILLQFKQSSK